MALLNGLMNDMPKYVTVANRSDYCEFCARDLQAKNDTDYNKQFQALKGKLEGHKILKFTKGGAAICVCKEHLKKLSKLLDEE
jgi:hypothetical protein